MEFDSRKYKGLIDPGNHSLRKEGGYRTAGSRFRITWFVF
ncbi:hypothetical protein PGR6_50140 [Pseudomonas sp. GR 6-02]|nr:hypothetical protein PGR6_50140 [Pseudomonas sp. GR 6-02]